MILFRRLADVIAATSISDLIAGNPAFSGADVTLDLGDGETMLLTQANLQALTAGQPMDWSLVTRVKIMRVCHVE